jgi:hypothetical protein
MDPVVTFHVRYDFAAHHIAFWEWLWAIELEVYWCYAFGLVRTIEQSKHFSIWQSKASA